MKNKKYGLIQRSLALFLASAVFFGNLPASAADFSSNQEIRQEVFEEEALEEETLEKETLEEETLEEETFEANNFEDNTFSGGTAPDSFSSDEEEIFGTGEAEEQNEGDNNKLDYIKGRPLTEEETEEQLAPIRALTTYPAEPEVESNLDISTFALFPPAYDAREESFITSVKNQNPFGICWAFCMASVLETSLLSQGLGTWDLSEEHLAYFIANRENDPLGNTPNDRNEHRGTTYHEGGSNVFASLFLSTWSGMATEEAVPLPTNDTHTQNLSTALSPSLAYNTAAYLENAYMSAYSVERTKQLITLNYSVSASVLFDSNYYNTDTAALCGPNSGTINHAITIIGWDDYYSKDNFPEASNVVSDGAWIVKNSWGTGWGKDGYFYISYEDKSLTGLVTATATTQPEYPNNYFYDGSSGNSRFNFSPGSSIANVFTARAGNGNAEALGEIVVAANSDNAVYEIQVYTNLSNPSEPTSGIPAFNEPLVYEQPIAGVATIRIPEVTIVQNTSYSIVLKNPEDSGTISYFCEADTTQTSWFYTYAGIEAGQGFLRNAGSQTWSDLATSKLTPRIKAHTRTLDTPAATPTPTPTSTPTPTPTAAPTATAVPKTYTVKYNANTGSKVSGLPSDSTKYTNGQTVKVKSAPTCTSKFFTGWNTKANGKGTSYAVGKAFKIKGNVTLYAQWKTNYTASNNLKYKVNGKKTVSCCGISSKTKTTIRIPAAITYSGITYKVTNVANQAFKNNRKLTSVTIGNNVKTIGNYAFYKCRNLKKVTIGTGLTTIGNHAFCYAQKGCVITIKSKNLKTAKTAINHGTKNMIIKVPQSRLSTYKKLFRKTSRTVTVKAA